MKPFFMPDFGFKWTKNVGVTLVAFFMFITITVQLKFYIINTGNDAFGFVGWPLG
jgi:hypothetical protein